MNMINRLKEPSTYAGLAALAVVLGFQMEDFQNWVHALAGAFGFASILMGEKSE